MLDGKEEKKCKGIRKPVIKKDISFEDYERTQVPVKEKCILEIEQNTNRKTEAEFFIVKAPNSKALIGLPTCQNLNKSISGQ